MAPRVAKDKVIVGVAGGEFTPHRGFFSALDVKTGREQWRFYTVPGDPSKPVENPALAAAAKTWAGECGDTEAADRCGTDSPTIPTRT
jgi:outer membrane protein assembly factor BamB